MTRTVLGIDAGTTAVKAVVYDLAGAVLATGHRPVEVVRGERGVAETDMEGIWLAVVAAVREALAGAGEVTVEGIGVTGQGDGAWLVDDQGRPVRPAALWLDGRGAARVDDWLASGAADHVVRATGSAPFPGTLPILLEEFEADEPEVLARAAHHLNCKDWIRHRLTGTIATDPSESSRTYLDTATVRYSQEMIDGLGHGRWQHLLPPVQDPQAVAGSLLPEVAADLGLPAGIPVAVGLVDSAACPVGLGAITDGDCYIVLGTTATVAMLHPDRSGTRSETAIIIPTGRGTQVLEALSSMAGTPNLDWARQTLGLADRSWDDLEPELRQVPPGSGGVLYLPYGSPSGERAPFVDTAASASWLGLSVAVTPVQVLRSTFEGVALAMTECLDILGATGAVRICGGGARSDLMCQLLADISGRDVVRTEDPEIGVRGASTVALVAAGIEPDLPSAVAAFRSAETRFTARPDARYDHARTVFQHVRDALRPQWPALRAGRP